MDPNLDENLEAIGAKRTGRTFEIRRGSPLALSCSWCGKSLDPKEAVGWEGKRFHPRCAVSSESGEISPLLRDGGSMGLWGFAESVAKIGEARERRPVGLPPGLAAFRVPIPFKGARAAPPGSLADVPPESGYPPRPASCSAFDALSAEEKVREIRASFGKLPRGAAELLNLSRIRMRARRMAATLDEVDLSFPRFVSRWRPRRPYDRERDE